MNCCVKRVLCLGAVLWGVLVSVAQEVPENEELTGTKVAEGGTKKKPAARKRYPKAIVMRGPYLQLVGPHAATLRWHTNAATDSKLEVGTEHGTYTLSALREEPTQEHEVRITGLQPGTRYYYRFGSSSHWLQDDAENFFTTAPPDTTSRRIGVAVFGDCGRNQKGYRPKSLRAYRAFTGDRPADVMLLLGDNAYNNGRDREYQSRFFNVYDDKVLKHHALFPTPGNHEYANSPERQKDLAIPYYDIFSLPSQGECGGVPSGTEAYYSFDWGNIHFLSLDSYGLGDAGTTRFFDTTGAQAQWIKRDLEANKKKWIVAYWHHPPHSMGSHNSDREPDLYPVRERLTPILERYGVDLILTGHSHNYERSYPLKRFYGKEASFDPKVHTTSTSNGRYDGGDTSCPYVKKSGDPYNGTVYVVAGSSGAHGKVQEGYPHNAMPFSIHDGGMFYFEVEGNRLDAKFLHRDGTVADQFTILKDVNREQTLTASAGQPLTLKANWTGDYRWSNGATTPSITVTPTADATYTVTDGKGCLQERFVVKVEEKAEGRSK